MALWPYGSMGAEVDPACINDSATHLPQFDWLPKTRQNACAKLSSAEIALFMEGDPSAIDYRSASLQEQVRVKMF